MGNVENTVSEPLVFKFFGGEDAPNPLQAPTPLQNTLRRKVDHICALLVQGEKKGIFAIYK